MTARADEIELSTVSRRHSFRGRGSLLEVPLNNAVQDCLHFSDYADVIAEHVLAPGAWPVGVGILGQWGAGKSSLLKLILAKLRTSGIQTVSGGRLCQQFIARFGVGTLLHVLLTRCWDGTSCLCWSCRLCGCYAHVKHGNGDDVESPLLDEPQTYSRTAPRVTCIVTGFDAWLFADSDVLWAVLISQVFKQVEDHPCFGKGAVRASRVRYAVEAFTCMDWAVTICTAVVLLGLMALSVVIYRGVDEHDGMLVEVLAVVAFTGLPLSIVMGAIKALPFVFKGQGQQILSEAQSMGGSVGTDHLGFLAKVRDEMQVLLRMIKAKCTPQDKYVLVVSIDNLDRCPPRQIIKVLETVHLLFAQDETNVVLLLAFDPRVIIAAIEADMDPEMRRQVSGAEYLDKIIHWPFFIPLGTKTERLKLVGTCLRTPWLGSSGFGATPTRGNFELPEAGTYAQRACIPPSLRRYAPHELEEFRALVDAVVTTPRKIKRVCNIYSLQHSLGIKTVPRFGEEDARKLVRWTFISEFWPFRASCLIAYSVPHSTRPEETLANVYETNVKACIEQLIATTNSSSSSSSSGGGGQARAAARRHVGMDESEDGIIRFLESKPQIMVQDFHEKNLGLLRLSFNLNPAMIESVSSLIHELW